jgi:hypothetical protein
MATISWPERAGISLEALVVRMVKSGVVHSRHRSQRSVRCATSDRAKIPAIMAYEAPVRAARTAHTNVTPAPRLASSEVYDGPRPVPRRPVPRPVPRPVQRSSTYRPSASAATSAKTRSTSAMGLERNAMPRQPNAGFSLTTARLRTLAMPTQTRYGTNIHAAVSLIGQITTISAASDSHRNTTSISAQSGRFTVK